MLRKSMRKISKPLGLIDFTLYNRSNYTRFNTETYQNRNSSKKSTMRDLNETGRNWHRKVGVLSYKQNYNNYTEQIKSDICKRSPTLECEKSFKIIQQILQIIGSMNQNLFQYEKIEIQIKTIILYVQKIDSKVFLFRTLVFAAVKLFQYSNFSLAIFYLDRALKILYSQSIIYRFQRKQELLIYKTAAKIFLQKGHKLQARQLAFKYLRKSWFLVDENEQFQAYDFLGKIENQLGNLTMSKYFHQRMCKGERQCEKIIKFSNWQLKSIENQKQDFTFSKDIMHFIEKDKLFHQMLINYYKSKGQNFEEKLVFHRKRRNQFAILTHRSPNRVTKNYHTFQRKMHTDKSSEEIHFIRPTQIKLIKKVLFEYSKLIVNLKSKLIKSLRYDEQTVEQDEY